MFFGKLVKAVVMMLMVFVELMKTAPTERGVVRPVDRHSPEGPLKADEFLKLWFQGRAEDRTTTSGLRSDHKQRLEHHRPASDPRKPALDHRKLGSHHRPSSGPVLDHKSSPSSRREQILEMISALEGVHRSMNSTLSSRLTVMTRASGRHPGKKNKLLDKTLSDKAAAVLKVTTTPPSVSNSTVTLPHNVTTARSLKKSVPPLHKKPNKRGV
uniref:Uncharacterized protein n=1 Tax=Knipowitschia caucasica TaxID=637954 RepID=A0AAV2LDE9_KNICA